jgi:hypothetical protein
VPLRFKKIVSCIASIRMPSLVVAGRNIAIALAILESVRIVEVRDK